MAEYTFSRKEKDQEGVVYAEDHKSTYADTWCEVLDEFWLFLMGCGFIIDEDLIEAIRCTIDDYEPDEKKQYKHECKDEDGTCVKY